MLSKEIITIIGFIFILCFIFGIGYAYWKRNILKIGKIEGSVILNIKNLNSKKLYRYGFIFILLLIVADIIFTSMYFESIGGFGYDILFYIFLFMNFMYYNRIWYGEKGFLGGGLIRPVFWKDTEDVIWDKDIGQLSWGVNIILKNHRKIRLYFPRQRVEEVKSGFENHLINFADRVKQSEV